MRVWFNKAFSSLHSVLESIRGGDVTGEFDLVCSHDHPRFTGFQSAHHHALEPANRHGDEYLSFCLDFCKQEGIEVFFPGREAVLLAENATRFESLGVRLISTASPDNLRTIHDKLEFYSNSAECCVPPAEFCAFDSLPAFDAAYADLRSRHPVLCVKPAKGVFGIGFRIIDEHRLGLDLLLTGHMHHIPLHDFRRLLDEADFIPSLLLMEYLDGVEYSADCVGDGNQLVALVQRRKPLDGLYGQDIVDLPAIRAACAELASHYGLLGLFNVQFREGRGGLRLLEVNPRFSGGIGMSCANGVNLPYLAVRGAIHGFAGQGLAVSAAVGSRVAEIPRAHCVETKAA